MKGFMGKILLLQLSCPPAEDYNVALHRGPTLQIFTANCSHEFLQPICLESEQLSSYLEVESPPNSPMIKCVKKKKKKSVLNVNVVFLVYMKPVSFSASVIDFPNVFNNTYFCNE